MTFKQLFRKCMALVRAAAAMAGRMVLMPIRAVDGTMSWIWGQVRGGAGPVAYEADEIVEDLRQPAQDPGERALERIGEKVRLAATQMLSHGRVLTTDIQPALRVYVEGMDRGDLVALTRASDLAVGRHVAGLEILKDDVGIDVRRPEPAADEKRAAKKRDEVAVRKQAAAAERERRLERENPSPVFSLVPSL